MTKTIFLAILVSGVLMGAVGCGSGMVNDKNPPLTPAQAEAGKAVQGPIKAAHGGGSAPEPEMAKPGDKVGAPGPGPKAGGG